VCRREFDIVYTSIGVLPWLPDLTRWAQVVAGLLRPGGLFYLRDAHPILNGMQYDRTDGALVLTGPYFPTGVPVRYEDGTTYADVDARLAWPTPSPTNGRTRWPRSCSPCWTPGWS